MKTLKITAAALLLGMTQVMAQPQVGSDQATIYRDVVGIMDVNCTDNEAEVMLLNGAANAFGSTDPIACQIKTNHEFWNVSIEVGNGGKLAGNGRNFKTDTGAEIITINAKFVDSSHDVYTVTSSGNNPVKVDAGANANASGDVGFTNLADALRASGTAVAFKIAEETTSHIEIRAGIAGAKEAVPVGRYETSVTITAQQETP